MLIFCFTNLIDCLCGTIFHISDISLIFPSNVSCETNEIIGMKLHNSSILLQQTSNEEPVASSMLTFIAQLIKGKMKAYSL